VVVDKIYRMKMFSVSA